MLVCVSMALLSRTAAGGREPLLTIARLQRECAPGTRNAVHTCIAGFVIFVSEAYNGDAAKPAKQPAARPVSRDSVCYSLCSRCRRLIGFANSAECLRRAMTVNFALACLSCRPGNTLSAIGSVIALIGFVSGCLIGFTLRRGRSERAPSLCCWAPKTRYCCCLPVYHCGKCRRRSLPAMGCRSFILSVAMGLQAVVGQMAASTIVFTTTLTRLIGGIADAIATRNQRGGRTARRQGAGYPDHQLPVGSTAAVSWPYRK